MSSTANLPVDESVDQSKMDVVDSTSASSSSLSSSTFSAPSSSLSSPGSAFHSPKAAQNSNSAPLAIGSESKIDADDGMDVENSHSNGSNSTSEVPSATTQTTSSSASELLSASSSSSSSSLLSASVSMSVTPSPSPLPDEEEERWVRALTEEDRAAADASSAAAVSSSAPPAESPVLDEHDGDEADRVKSATEVLVDNLIEQTNRYLEGQQGKKVYVADKKKKSQSAHRRRAEDIADEVDEQIEELEEEERGEPLVLSAQPSLIMNGTLRPYQIEGLNWLIQLKHRGSSAILADEMGLGKTLQTISFFAYMKEFANTHGPHLVLVPLSTLGNWDREFTKWCPSMRVYKFHGNKEERAKAIKEGKLLPGAFEVLLTSYEIAIREKGQIHKHQWEYIVVDEAHRLKNENSLLSQLVRWFKSKFRLLLTGTPLQNNLHELWALLNFLVPEVFQSSVEFDQIFESTTDSMDQTGTAHVLSKLHRILRPFMLRRLKTQVETELPPKKEILVYVGMTEVQNRQYQKILSEKQTLDVLTGNVKERARLLNIMMQLRKAANHPYLFEGVEDRENLPPLGEHLILAAGKLVVLDKMLSRFKREDHRVLIFTQMTRCIDILEDYCLFREYKYCRLDGNTSQLDREASMKAFNEPNSDKFIFLLSTRAGGLGINLTTADTVVLYDSDWNPQMDLQAMDRSHRIGQKKPVNVYRLVTENTIEEQILKRAAMKLRLDAIVIRQGGGMSQRKGGAGLSTEDMTNMIRYGADRVFRQSGSTVSEEDIDAILARGEKLTQQMNSELEQKMGAMMNLSLDGAAANKLVDDQSVDVPDDVKDRAKAQSFEETKRERAKPKSYNENKYYHDAFKGNLSESNLLKPHKVPKMMWFQFFNQKLIDDLSEKEKKFHAKWEGQFDNPPAKRGINAEEEKQLLAAIDEGFGDWSYSDYMAFVKSCQRYGRDSKDKIAKHMNEATSKSAEQVERYYKAFWEKILTIPGGESIVKKIEKAEVRVKKYAQNEAELDILLGGLTERNQIMENLELKYMKGNANTLKGFTLQEDRFLLYACREVGYGEWRLIKKFIRMDEEFQLDFFLKSRSAAEVGKRVESLVTLLKKQRRDMEKRATTLAAGKEKGKKRKADSANAPTTQGATAADGKAEKKDSDHMQTEIKPEMSSSGPNIARSSSGGALSSNSSSNPRSSPTADSDVDVNKKARKK